MELTPMLQQYADIKAQHPRELLMFRLGDFYELFGDDAKQASKILEIVLTARGRGTDHEMPMCGIPYHALDQYLVKLLKAGQRVAICDQLNAPTQTGDSVSPGLVKREVTRVITPGTTLEDSTLRTKENNFIAALCLQKNIWGLALADLTTGEFKVAEITDVILLQNELRRLGAAETVLSSDLANDSRFIHLWKAQRHLSVYALASFEKPYNILTRQFKQKNLHSFGLENLKAGIEAAGLLMSYLQNTQKAALSHLVNISRYRFDDFMLLDDTTTRNLEIFSSNSGQERGSLLSVIDRTATSMGGRLLRKWLLMPILKVAEISERHAAVEELIADQSLLKKILEKFSVMADLERLVGKIGCGRCSARDLVTLKNSLELVPEIKNHLINIRASLLKQLVGQLDGVAELRQLIGETFVDEPPILITDGGMVRDGYNAELDELRRVSRGGKEWLAAFQVQEINRTGINSLKVRFNSVFGYYIEISKANLAQVPAEYIRKQTLVNAERFITPELKEYEDKILGAEDKIISIETQIFREALEKIAPYFSRVQETAGALAGLDVLMAFAQLAIDNRYCRPVMSEGGELIIKNGRHPVIETFQNWQYVPNDLEMDHEKNEFLLLTGPNMSGKSSYLRQTALIVLLAQIGSFVPAEAANIGVVDRIFTRVGASDNLAEGVSTFMVEMQEATNILHNATAKSLVILDELGRGTSTYDGVSIALAIIEYIHNELRAKTIFATHYHELTEAVDKLSRAVNYCVAVSEDQGRVIFLHKIIKGATSESYGIEVAKIAGLPETVIARAYETLVSLEGRITLKNSSRAKQGQLPLAANPKEKLVAAAIADLDVNALTPIEALQKIDELKKKMN